MRELTEETSLGFMMIEFASEVLGIDLFPWQRWLLIHAFELHPMWTTSTMAQRTKMDPLFRFRKVVVLVARQNGKSTVSQVVALFFLYALGAALTLGTAQDLDTAEEVWDGCLDLIEETPELQERAARPIKVNGKKTIRLKTGERYKVKAANRKAGRGLSGDLVMLDEIREHQSWDAWAAITKTATARAAAMILCLSNAGDMSSVVLRFLRLTCHEALGDPDGIVAASKRQALLPTIDDIDTFTDLTDEDEQAEDALEDLAPIDFEEDVDSLGLFEWSSPPGCDVMDRAALAQANPSVGYGITWTVLLGDARTEGRSPETEWIFRTEAMCQWPEGSIDGVFPSGTWEGTTNQPVPQKITSDVTACVAVSGDRSRAWVAICGERDDGQVQADVVASRRGVGWVKDYLLAEKDRLECVTLQERGAGATSELYEDLRTDPEFTIPVIAWGGPNLTAWYGRTHDAIRDGLLRHNPQQALDHAAGSAVKKKLAGGWVLDLFDKSADAAPLAAFCGAYGCYTRSVTTAPPPPLPVAITSTAPASRARGSITAADIRTMSF